MLLFSCNKQAPNEVYSQASAAIPKEELHTDFTAFLNSVFPDLKAAIAASETVIKSQELSNNRSITIFTFDTPQTETFVIWEKQGDYYIKLLSMHERGGAIQSVIEYDLNQDKKSDLVLKSCSETYGTYTDIFINRSTEKKVKYERLIKTTAINPVILDLDNNDLPEIIMVNGADLPFHLSELDFADDQNRFIHQEKKLLAIQHEKAISKDQAMCNPMVDTPLLVNYPIKIYNVSKYGTLDEVTKNHTEILALHLESVFNSNFLSNLDGKPRMAGLWKEYLLTYLDTYYVLKTDSSYRDYLVREQAKLNEDF